LLKPRQSGPHVPSADWLHPTRAAAHEIRLVYYFIPFGVECATCARRGSSARPPNGSNSTTLHRQTITILPRPRQPTRTNLEHLILMALTLLTAITTLIAFAPSIFNSTMVDRSVIGVVIVAATLFQFCFREKQNRTHRRPDRLQADCEFAPLAEIQPLAVMVKEPLTLPDKSAQHQCLAGFDADEF